MFVDKYYEMNPETDDLILDTKKLRNGMVVLIEDPRHRAHIVENMDDHRGSDTYRTALKYNRWCTVSAKDDDSAEFIGLYSDGGKRSFRNDAHQAWIVKKDSMLPSDNTVAKVVPAPYPIFPTPYLIAPTSSTEEAKNYMKQYALSDDPEWVKNIDERWKNEKTEDLTDSWGHAREHLSKETRKS